MMAARRTYGDVAGAPAAGRPHHPRKWLQGVGVDGGETQRGCVNGGSHGRGVKCQHAQTTSTWRRQVTADDQVQSLKAAPLLHSRPADVWSGGGGGCEKRGPRRWKDRLWKPVLWGGWKRRHNAQCRG